MVITQVRLYEQSLDGSLTNSKFQDFYPTIATGLDVHINGGRLKNSFAPNSPYDVGISTIAEQTFTVPDDSSVDLIMDSSGAITAVISDGSINPILDAKTYISIARVVSASGVITSLTDIRPVFTVDNSRIATEFNIIKTGSLTVQVNGSASFKTKDGQVVPISSASITFSGSNPTEVLIVDEFNKTIINPSEAEPGDYVIAFVHISGGEVQYYDDARVFAQSLDTKPLDLAVRKYTSGLSLQVNAGIIRIDNVITSIAFSYQSVTDNATNYIEVDNTGTISVNTTGFTAGRIPLAIAIAASGDVTSLTDKRAWLSIATSTPPSNDTVTIASLTDFYATDGGGLNLVVANGRIRINNTIINKSGATLSLINNSINYIGIDNFGNFFVDSNDAVAITTVNIDTVPLWKVTTASGSITTIIDLRTWVNFDTNKNFKITYNSESTSVNVESGDVIIGNSYQTIGSAGFTLSAGYNWIYADLENNVLAVTTNNPLQDADASHNKYVLYKLHVASGNIDTDFTDFRHLPILNSGIPSDLKVYGINSGLNIKVLGGKIRVDSTIIDVAPSSVFPVTDNTTNYVQVDSSGSVSFNTTGFTLGTLPLAIVVTSGGNVTSVTDERTWLIVAVGGEHILNETPSGTQDGVNTDFTLVYTPISNSEQVYLNGLRQKPTADYNISTNVISFIDAPESTDSILVDYRRL